MNMQNPSVQGPAIYVLITPVKNEAAFIGAAIESILAQTILPRRWVIVSDGSTDDTDAIVSRYAAQHGFIQLIRVEPAAGRSFGSKALAVQRGVQELSNTPFDFLGNLDADITLEAGYYERMLHEMAQNPQLGLASGVCWDKTPDGFKCVTVSVNHAVGAVHFFRRACFEAVGGYRPVSVGGMDSLAVLTARMKGWLTRCFPDLPVYHHKPVDSAGGRKAATIAYRAGMTEYHIGTHPLFAFVKAVRRWRSSPVLGSVFIRLCGYARLWFTGVRRDASNDLVTYLRREQMGILKNLLRGQKGL